MPVCRHETLTLIVEKNNRLRCRHCHLTIDEDELGSGCCPECLEAHNIRRRDFERLNPAADGQTRYCCSACGLIVAC